MDVKTLCLGILIRGDATGYEIKKECEEGPFCHFHAAGFGSIYPALNALCDKGLVSVQAQAQAKRPDKKVYSITGSGRLALAEALMEPPGNDRIRSDFWFILFFSHLLEPRELDAVIQTRIDARKAKVAELERYDVDTATAGERFVFGWGLAVTQAEIEYLENNRYALVGESLKGAVRPAESGIDAQPVAPEERQTAAE